MKQKHSEQRFVDGEELAAFQQLNKQERLKWIREELNKIYHGRYTVRQVAEDSRVISHQGLYKLESGDTASVRTSTVKALADYYQVPMDAIESPNPSPFFLGETTQELHPNELTGAFYTANISLSLTRPDGETEELVNIREFSLRRYDAEKLAEKIKNECRWIEKDLDYQGKVAKAVDKLSGENEESGT